jgi:hypothetical protein
MCEHRATKKGEKTMKAISWLYVIGTALLALPGTAAAQGITYDCDTAANHFSELDLPTDGAPFTVSGNVQLNSLAASKEYAAVARVQVAPSVAPGQPPAAFAGFALTALPVDPKKSPSGATAIQALSWSVNGKDDEILPLSIMTKPGTLQPFTMSYDGSKVSVTLGTETKSFALGAAKPVVRIVCSTGEFLFTDLTIKSNR